MRCALIGAIAVKHHVDLPRTTGDVDLALDADPNTISAVLQKLGWRQDPKVLQRWRGPNQALADILPATAEDIAQGAVRFDEDSKEMSLVGFDLLFQHGTEVAVPDSNVTIHVASLPTLVVLKVVAWLDRPQERKKDLGDLAIILRTALASDDERRWDGSMPEESTTELQSAYFVGCEVRNIAREAHRAAIDQFLDILSDENSTWAAVMAREAKLAVADGEAEILAVLGAFSRGYRSEPV
jgi:predicted nucleotidyltransferase